MEEQETKWVMMGISLTTDEQKIVHDHIQEQHLGKKGFSLALRQIIREWDEMKRKQAEVKRIFQ